MSLDCGRKSEHLEETQVNMCRSWKRPSERTRYKTLLFHNQLHWWFHVFKDLSKTFKWHILIKWPFWEFWVMTNDILRKCYYNWEQQEALGRQKVESFPQQSTILCPAESAQSVATLEMTHVSCAIWFCKSSFKRWYSSAIMVPSMWKLRWHLASVNVSSFNFKIWPSWVLFIVRIKRLYCTRHVQVCTTKHLKRNSHELYWCQMLSSCVYSKYLIFRYIDK